MNTPICDFVRSYAESDSLRLHMPGHKGVGFLGYEAFDITEIQGADSLYETDGIIAKSEENASYLFGSKTYYSAEGSSLAIRAMLYLTCMYAKQKGETPYILAGRNAHKVFLSSAALLGFELEWLYSASESSYLSCVMNSQEIERKLNSLVNKPTAVYLTTPDYLGNEIDISSIAEVCHRYGVLLLVDNAHGAYMKFLKKSRHPIDLGADMCCDSAHKTLPVLTGGAYIHISDGAPPIFTERAKDALGMFGSTSPSYLILQSLDAANKYIADGYSEKLECFIHRVDQIKRMLRSCGYEICKSEELKITIKTKSYGYYGVEFAELLKDKGLICEYSDPDFVVMMLTPENENRLDEIPLVMKSLPARTPITSLPPVLKEAVRMIGVREAYFSDYEEISAENASGRVLAVSDVSCPPAVPVLVSGELIDESSIKCFQYYGITKCKVIK